MLAYCDEVSGVFVTGSLQSCNAEIPLDRIRRRVPRYSCTVPDSWVPKCSVDKVDCSEDRRGQRRIDRIHEHDDNGHLDTSEDTAGRRSACNNLKSRNKYGDKTLGRCIKKSTSQLREDMRFTFTRQTRTTSSCNQTAQRLVTANIFSSAPFLSC